MAKIHIEDIKHRLRSESVWVGLGSAAVDVIDALEKERDSIQGALSKAVVDRNLFVATIKKSNALLLERDQLKVERDHLQDALNRTAAERDVLANRLDFEDEQRGIGGGPPPGRDAVEDRDRLKTALDIARRLNDRLKASVELEEDRNKEIMDDRDDLAVRVDDVDRDCNRLIEQLHDVTVDRDQLKAEIDKAAAVDGVRLVHHIVHHVHKDVDGVLDVIQMIVGEDGRG